MLGAVAGARRFLDRLLDRLDDDLALDRFLARHGVGDLQELQPVGGNAGQGVMVWSFSTSGLSASRLCRRAHGFGVARGRGEAASAAKRAARASAPRRIRASVITSLASTSQAKGSRAVSLSPSRLIADAVAVDAGQLALEALSAFGQAIDLQAGLEALVGRRSPSDGSAADRSRGSRPRAHSRRRSGRRRRAPTRGRAPVARSPPPAWFRRSRSAMIWSRRALVPPMRRRRTIS